MCLGINIECTALCPRCLWEVHVHTIIWSDEVPTQVYRQWIIREYSVVNSISSQTALASKPLANKETKFWCVEAVHTCTLIVTDQRWGEAWRQWSMVACSGLAVAPAFTTHGPLSTLSQPQTPCVCLWPPGPAQSPIHYSTSPPYQPPWVYARHTAYGPFEVHAGKTLVESLEIISHLG